MKSIISNRVVTKNLLLYSKTWIVMPLLYTKIKSFMRLTQADKILDATQDLSFFHVLEYQCFELKWGVSVLMSYRSWMVWRQVWSNNNLIRASHEHVRKQTHLPVWTFGNDVCLGQSFKRHEGQGSREVDRKRDRQTGYRKGWTEKRTYRHMDQMIDR